MRYPTSKSETIADGIVHLISICVGLIATLLMWQSTAMWQSTGMAWAVGIYLAILVSAFVVSGTYHMTPISPLRVALRRADHALIFIRISSSYTPLVLIINTPFAYIILAGVWAVAAFGFANKLLFWEGTGGSSIKLYSALSAAMILLLWPMWQTINHGAIWLILAGGAMYGVGAIIYSRKDMPYRYPVWHIFATSSSMVFYVAIQWAIS